MRRSERHRVGAIAGSAFALALVLSQAPAFADNAPVPPDASSKAAPPAGDKNAGPAQPSETKLAPPPGGEANGANPVEGPSGNEPAIPPMLEWSFSGVLGHYDTAQLQRGFQIYKQVCSNCHSMKLVAFRNLTSLGYNEGQIKALAASYQIDDFNEKGEAYKRPGRPADYLPSPFPNAEAGAAAYGKAPPDMSVLAKARGWERGFPWFILDFFTQSEESEGPDYIHAVLNGYTKADDNKYNIYLPNHKIAMPKPLSDGQVEYSDGTPQTLDQYSKDVAAFLMWAAEPKLEERKATGVRAMFFLIVFASLLYFVKKRIWARVGGDVVIGAH